MIDFATLLSGSQTYRIADMAAVAGEDLPRLPVILRILLENVLRNSGGDRDESVAAILGWLASGRSESEIAFQPSRILMHDTTCGPALVDIAGLRASLSEAGGDPTRLNPVLPVDISTDHSLGVDVFAQPDAIARNMAHELTRNGERYRFMKWASQALSGVRVHPPGTGIMHTLNLERLASVVTTSSRNGETWAVPDTLIGTDSHTPMINGIGVLAWGVGGLEAESVMFGMPVTMRVPDVVGVRLTGRPREGVLATDLALTVTARLRQVDLADRFVEFFGPGVSALSAGDRAVIANMTPEFGANSGYFPIDGRTLDYLGQTGRSREQLALVEAYARHQKLWFDPEATPRYTETISIDLDAVEVSLAGPRRPQDRIAAGNTAEALSLERRFAGTDADRASPPADGAVAIAAITSCTNTSDPRLLIAAGLLARKARSLGLKPPVWVKTSLAPGSPTAERYLRRAGLLDDLAALGFGIVGYGCTTCIGNSGPLAPRMARAMAEQQMTPVAVLSGNRNFPGRVHAQIEHAFLASPPLVVAFALAGDVARDILRDPIAHDTAGIEVRLADIWPTGREIDAALAIARDTSDYSSAYDAAEASADWAAFEAPGAALFPWDDASTYIRRPPFADFGSGTRLGHYAATPLLVLGDDITTDHISPAGAIAANSEAARYLVARGEDPNDLNVFAARRGNWEVMLRGLFTNKSVHNLLGPDLPAGQTILAASGERVSLGLAAERYAAEKRPVVIVAGERYGMGSSRDWAAKGVALLGARAVLATSFERIHRSNLIGMGILPLRLPPDRRPQTLGLRPDDRLEIDAPSKTLKPRAAITIRILRDDAEIDCFVAIAAVETNLECATLRVGGLLPLILRRHSGGSGVSAGTGDIAPAG
ncbi:MULTISPECIES: aconitate hydratase AcnA [unclassified Bradyrhizobium]|uniref:aconitate hydratase AcnA n=1 Tax=unclassified Bradyrhizobium TaxID=2631580 RepID=UPI0024792786|nr:MULTISPECIES: aconitate hydratase AcnA [unclassified Bradyrhizobium]WGR73659.1 aconitate hydratase AcnA [Bradyrhizobium sp. ISRA426]WGR78497.1 aconitate hydratase AcnA [Bradyrhizobium sp. ISRA430]WGR88898.1 aconitate hydratase AcnA [Bradyrhizobium sp. ISRA432]